MKVINNKYINQQQTIIINENNSQPLSSLSSQQSNKSQLTIKDLLLLILKQKQKNLPFSMNKLIYQLRLSSLYIDQYQYQEAYILLMEMQKQITVIKPTPNQKQQPHQNQYNKANSSITTKPYINGLELSIIQIKIICNLIIIELVNNQKQFVMQHLQQAITIIMSSQSENNQQNINPNKKHQNNKTIEERYISHKYEIFIKSLLGFSSIQELNIYSFIQQQNLLQLLNSNNKGKKNHLIKKINLPQIIRYSIGSMIRILSIQNIQSAYKFELLIYACINQLQQYQRPQQLDDQSLVCYKLINLKKLIHLSEQLQTPQTIYKKYVDELNDLLKQCVYLSGLQQNTIFRNYSQKLQIGLQIVNRLKQIQNELKRISLKQNQKQFQNQLKLWEYKSMKHKLMSLLTTNHENEEINANIFNLVNTLKSAYHNNNAEASVLIEIIKHFPSGNTQQSLYQVSIQEYKQKLIYFISQSQKALQISDDKSEAFHAIKSVQSKINIKQPKPKQKTNKGKHQQKQQSQQDDDWDEQDQEDQDIQIDNIQVIQQYVSKNIPKNNPKNVPQNPPTNHDESRFGDINYNQSKVHKRMEQTDAYRKANNQQLYQNKMKSQHPQAFEDTIEYSHVKLPVTIVQTKQNRQKQVTLNQQRPYSNKFPQQHQNSPKQSFKQKTQDIQYGNSPFESQLQEASQQFHYTSHSPGVQARNKKYMNKKNQVYMNYTQIGSRLKLSNIQNKQNTSQPNHYESYSIQQQGQIEIPRGTNISGRNMHINQLIISNENALINMNANNNRRDMNISNYPRDMQSQIKNHRIYGQDAYRVADRSIQNSKIASNDASSDKPNIISQLKHSKSPKHKSPKHSTINSKTNQHITHHQLTYSPSSAASYHGKRPQNQIQQSHITQTHISKKIQRPVNFKSNVIKFSQFQQQMALNQKKSLIKTNSRSKIEQPRPKDESSVMNYNSLMNLREKINESEKVHEQPNILSYFMSDAHPIKHKDIKESKKNDDQDNEELNFRLTKSELDFSPKHNQNSKIDSLPEYQNLKIKQRQFKISGHPPKTPSSQLSKSDIGRSEKYLSKIIYNHNQLLKKNIRLCRFGQYIDKKHYTSDGGQQRFLRLSQDELSIQWGVSQEKLLAGNHKKYELKNIRGVIYGKVTATMRKQFNKLLQPHKCISLIFQKRTFDIYCTEELDICYWLPGISHFINKQRPILDHANYTSRVQKFVKKRAPISSDTYNQALQLHRKGPYYSLGRVLWKRMLLKMQDRFLNKLKKGKPYKNTNAGAIIQFGKAIFANDMGSLPKQSKLVSKVSKSMASQGSKHR